MFSDGAKTAIATGRIIRTSCSLISSPKFAFKNSAGKTVLAGLVDTSGYSTAIAEKYQGFLITEAKLTFDGATLDPGQYGFGFKDGKFTVMNVAAGDMFVISCQKDDQLKHPVPLQFEKDGSGFKLYAGRAYISMKAD